MKTENKKKDLLDAIASLQATNAELLAALKAQVAVSLPLDCAKVAIAKAEAFRRRDDDDENDQIISFSKP